MPKLVQVEDHRAEVNCVPLSVVTVPGTPKRCKARPYVRRRGVHNHGQLRPHCGMCQVCCCEERLLGACKGGIHGRRPLQPVCPLPAAAQRVRQRPQRAGDAGQKSPVEIHHAQEGLQLLDDGGAGKNPGWRPRVKGGVARQPPKSCGPGTPIPGCPTRSYQRVSPARSLEGPAGPAARV